MAVGVSFTADVMKRYKQLVLVLRETVSSYTVSMLINDEGKNSLRSGLICLASIIAGRGKSIRIDPGPGLVSLVGDPELCANGISLELGRVKNPNKNPVAERCIEELGAEILKLNPHGETMSSQTLALATSNMNSRVRRDGLSSYEIWTQRDQFTGKQLNVIDKDIITSQTKSRNRNHVHSAKSKSRGKAVLPVHDVSEGSLVYVISDKDKTKAREKYIVVSKSGDWCKIRKFTRNQYRSKIYDMKLSEVYPITRSYHNTKVPEESAPISHSSDSDEQIDEPGGRCSSSVTTQEEVSSSESENEEPLNIRPQRQKRRPIWSKDYAMDDSYESD